MAAAFTAAGSLFNTMWTEKPWWKEDSQPAPIHAPAAAGEHRARTVREPSEPSEGGGRAFSSIDTDERESMVMAMSPAPEPTGWRGILYRLEQSPIAKWLIIGSALIGFGWILIEYFNRRTNKLN